MASLFDTRPFDAPVAYAKIALEQGIDFAPGGLTYGVPAALSDLAVGERVTVPLGRGNKAAPGYVLEVSESCDLPPAKLTSIKAILERDLSGISLTPDLVELAKWMASYYCCPLGMVFATMLPAAVKRGTGSVTLEMVGLPQEPAERTQEEKNDIQHMAAGAEQSATGVPPAAASLKVTKLQQAILEAAIKQRGAGRPFTEIRELADLAGAKTISPIRQLIEKGKLITQAQAAVRAAPSINDPLNDPKAPGAPGAPGLLLTPHQDAAIRHLSERIHAGFSVSLLHGVTGSGKTEVYLSAIERLGGKGQGPSAKGQGEAGGTEGVHNSTLDTRHSTLAHNPQSDFANHQSAIIIQQSPSPRTAIVLVPEIALTPQTVARFQQRFPDEVALLHSGLTPAQRHEQWRRIRRGEVRIVVGARSAIFAPLARIGIIIVDEEHESSYKQDQLPRYHARDVAIKRGQLLGVPVLLGSATPSLESWWNARGAPSRQGGAGSESPAQDAPPFRDGALARARYQLLRLPDRVPGLTLPKIDIVDFTQERRKRYEYSGKAGVHLLSIRLEAAIKQTLAAKAGTLLLLNRRGYANYIACPDHKCGWMMKCDYCDATMVYHKDTTLPEGGYLHCHHCTAKQMLPKLCPLCNKKVTVFGLGTQRVEEELAKKFPAARLLRMDSDSMRGSRDYEESLEKFRSGQIDILLGTQMIAKGLDFPYVRLVGVISADTALHMPDFRASERTFQLVSQVAGRAGRGGEPGTVIVQTFSPDDPAITLAAKHDYETFAQRELALRGEMGLPPVTRMARIVVRDKDHVQCVAQASALAAHLNETNAKLALGVRIRGPAPCPISRIAEFHRMQIEMIAGDAATLQKLMTALRNDRLLKSDNHTAVDVDPVDLL